MFRIVEFRLRPLERRFDRLLIDARLRDGVFRQHVNPIAFHLRETATDGEQERLSSLGDAKFAMLNLGQQRNVSRQNPDFTFDRGDNHGVDGVSIDACVGSDDFEGEWHFVWAPEPCA